MTKARLIVVTPDAEKMIAYMARVSNPQNQDNQDSAKLLAYCIRNKHWSIFEHSSMSVEVETSMAIGEQVLRHRSFCFQKFSQRYADVSLLLDEDGLFMPVELRRQDDKNRQSSHDDIPEEKQKYYQDKIAKLFAESEALYKEMLQDNIAKECARFVLPMATKTRMYITGNVRSWIHYLELRTEKGTQKEHRDVALACKEVFVKEFPQISTALNWK